METKYYRFEQSSLVVRPEDAKENAAKKAEGAANKKPSLSANLSQIRTYENGFKVYEDNDG